MHNLDAAKSPIPRSAQAVNDSVDNPVNRPTRHYFHMHLISDATGETLNTVARAAMAYYADYQPFEHIYALVRTPKQLQRVLREIERQPGIVLFTLDRSGASGLAREALRAPDHSLHLDPRSRHRQPAQYLNALSRPQIGRQHALNAEYFRRIDALNFTMLHDDGQHVADLEKADVVLIGISRTSKTPTSIYLANRGMKTANVPIVPDIPLPPELDRRDSSAHRRPCRQRRAYRADSPPSSVPMNEHRETAYVDRMAITEELVDMRKLCARQQLADHRRYAPLDRGNGGRHHQSHARPHQHRRDDRPMTDPTHEVVFASASPVRRQLLQNAGLAVLAMLPMSTKPRSTPNMPKRSARSRRPGWQLASIKAEKISARHGSRWVIGADQVLSCQGAIVSKPADIAEARRQLVFLAATPTR